MSFAVGDKVVYPHHGAAIIEGKEKRVFDGHKTDYFVLRITYGDLKVSIPVDKADEIGLRDVINDSLLGGELVETGFLSRPAVTTLVEDHRSGREDRSKQIWQLLTLELWYRQARQAGVTL